MKAFKEILLASDFSSHCESAVSVAADLSRRYEVPLGIVYVYEPVTCVLPDGYAVDGSVGLSELFEEFEKGLASVQLRAEAAGARNVRTYLRQGVAAIEISELARTRGFDLIVMGTHGRTGLSHLLLGSVAERVVRAAPCAVLTVRARACVSALSSEAVRPAEKSALACGSQCAAAGRVRGSTCNDSNGKRALGDT